MIVELTFAAPSLTTSGKLKYEDGIKLKKRMLKYNTGKIKL